MSDVELEDILVNGDIIRNRLKVFSVRKNALVFLAIQKEFGSFDNYIWGFTAGKTQVNRPASIEEIPTRMPLSDCISKDLKKRGMSFVGTTIIYAYMQAIGIVNDHTINLPIREQY
jgi:DNA-3-methyladenine glycosylase I